MFNKTISVFGNSELGAEFAVVLSENYKVAVVDADTISPSLDLLFNIPKDIAKITQTEAIKDNTGLNIALDATEKNLLTTEVLYECVQEAMRNVYVLTGNHNINSYEYMLPGSFEQLLQKIKETFEVVIICTSGFIYDTFTKIAIERSEIVLAPVSNGIIDIRSRNTIFEFLNEKNVIDLKSVKYVAFEYNKKTDLHLKVIRELTDNRLIGFVPISETRAKMRTDKKMFPFYIDQITAKCYWKIAYRLGLKVPKKKRPWYLFYKK